MQQKKINIKGAAKNLANCLKAYGVENISHSSSLNMISRVLGFTNYNTLSSENQEIIISYSKGMNMSKIKDKEIKKLYGNSAGRCNLCSMNLCEDDVQIGEMAHIIAKSQNGPRGNTLPVDNTYDNLILVCPNDHKIIDKNPLEYPPEKLKQIKKEFEELILKKLDLSKNYQIDLSSLNTLFKYIPIKNFRGMVMDLPEKISVHFSVDDIFNQFIMDNPDRFPFYDKKLTTLWMNFLEKIHKIEDWIEGSISIKYNKLITFSQMINNTYSNPSYNVYVNSEYDNEIMILNKEYLNSNQIDLVYKTIPILKQEFIYAHTELIEYIRYNFKEIIW